MICVMCMQERAAYLNDICKECCDKIDKHIEGEE